MDDTASELLQWVFSGVSALKIGFGDRSSGGAEAIGESHTEAAAELSGLVGDKIDDTWDATDSESIGSLGEGWWITLIVVAVKGGVICNPSLLSSAAGGVSRCGGRAGSAVSLSIWVGEGERIGEFATSTLGYSGIVATRGVFDCKADGGGMTSSSSPTTEYPKTRSSLILLSVSN